MTLSLEVRRATRAESERVLLQDVPKSQQQGKMFFLGVQSTDTPISLPGSLVYSTVARHTRRRTPSPIPANIMVQCTDASTRGRSKATHPLGRGAGGCARKALALLWRSPVAQRPQGCAMTDGNEQPTRECGGEAAKHDGPSMQPKHGSMEPDKAADCPSNSTGR